MTNLCKVLLLCEPPLRKGKRTIQRRRENVSQREHWTVKKGEEEKIYEDDEEEDRELQCRDWEDMIKLMPNGEIDNINTKYYLE